MIAPATSRQPINNAPLKPNVTSANESGNERCNIAARRNSPTDPATSQARADRISQRFIEAPALKRNAPAIAPMTNHGTANGAITDSTVAIGDVPSGKSCVARPCRAKKTKFAASPNASQIGAAIADRVKVLADRFTVYLSCVRSPSAVRLKARLRYNSAMPSRLKPSNFIGESIQVQFDQPPTLEKKPGCPNSFIWHNETFRIVELLAEWHAYDRKGRMATNMRPDHAEVASHRGSWGVGRDYFQVRVEGGRLFELYYDRAPRGSQQRKGAWFLVAELETSPD